jgi:hypothetical protein
MAVAGRRAVAPTNDEKTITDDEAFVLPSDYDEAEKKLVKFVEEQVELMNSHLLFSDREPTFFELNKSLAMFETVALGLTSLYASVRAAKDFAQEKYEDVYAEKFVTEKTSRTTLNPKDYSSAREVELFVRRKYMNELAPLRAAIIEAETKRSFVERLCENWKNYQFILSTMSKNAQAEASASSVSANNLPNLGD